MKRVLRLAAQVSQFVRRNWRRFIAWWVHNDRKYKVKWRIANAAAALLFVFSVALPILQANWTNKRYQLNAETLSLVGKNNQALADKLKYDAKTATYKFNTDAIKEFNPAAPVSQQVGGGGKDTKSLYALDVPEDFTKGVTYHDVNSQLSFSLVPLFKSLPGRAEQGRIVFPLNGGPQAVYTIKNNGLKEDIVVTGNKQPTLSFAYKLNLPKSLEAKALPGGGIGIYSGDPSLFSNMTYGSDKDRQLVEKARENAEKTNLVFGIPSPSITTKNGDIGSATSRFELKGNDLTVVAEDLTSIHSAFSIDPSVVITSASDLQTAANDEGNIDFDTANANISRGALTGGSIGSWATAAASGSTLFSARAFAATAAYNGYLYGISGQVSGGTGTSAVTYALICTGSNSGVGGCGSTAGQIGSWTAATTLAGNQLDTTSVVVYNGFMYVLGGGNSANTAYSNTYYAQICTGNNSGINGCGAAAGSLGTWNSGSALLTATAKAQAAVYNGYIYVMGGCSAAWINCGTRLDDIQIAQIKADGSLDTWTNNGGNVLTVTRHHGAAVAYNGKMYIMGGCTVAFYSQCTSGSNRASDTQYTTINADGTLSTSWTTSSNTIASPTLDLRASVYKGYIYYFTGGLVANQNTQYAQINADGSIGSIRLTTTYSATARDTTNTIEANGYIYIVGGCTSSNCGAATNDVQYSKIDTAGINGSFKTSAGTSYETDGVVAGTSIAYGGYLYILGGFNTNNINNTTTNVYYAALNSDGSVGNWATTSSFSQDRYHAAAAAYNGYMYLIGGGHTTANTGCSVASTTYCDDVQYAVINSNGTLGAWNSAGGRFSTTARAGLKAAVYNGRIYVMGGVSNSNSTLSNETNVGQIQPNGTVTGWTTSGTLVTATSNYSLAQSGPNLYILGGRTALNNNYDNYSEYAIVDSSGNVTWQALNNLFTNGRNDSVAGTNNGYVYINGGTFGAGTNVYSDTQYARICVDSSLVDGCNGTVGTLGTWHTGSSVTTGRTSQMAAIYNGYLYVMGGCSNQGLLGNCASSTAVLNDTQYSEINNGGNGMPTLGSDTASNGTGRGAFGTAVYNGYMYRVGGCSTVLLTNVNTCGAGIRDDVNYAPISSDGTVGTWQTTTALSTGTGVAGRFGLGAVAYNGRLYAIGGCSAASNGNCTSFKSDVQYIGINANGSLGASWSVAANTFSTGRYGLSAVVNQGYLYVLGGCSAMTSDTCTTTKSDVQVSLLDATTGLPGTWSSAGTDFTTARFYQSAVIYNNTLYILGGCSAMTSVNCTSFQGDVQYRPLNTSTGALSGSWAYTTGLPTARYGAAVVANNGYMYLIAGCSANATGNCTGYLGDVQYASISSGGGIGGWSTITGTAQALGTTRFLHGAAIVNNTLEVIGGNMTSNSFGLSQQSGTLAVQPRRGVYSKLLDLGRSTNIRSITYTGTAGTVSFNYRVAGSNGIFGSTAAASALAPTGTCTGNAQATRYIQVIVNIDDSAIATYGEGSGTTVADFTVNYYYTHPPPNIRLRGGQTLTTGDLSPLDTCGSMSPI